MRKDNEREGYGGAVPGGPVVQPLPSPNPDGLGPSPVVGDTGSGTPDFPAPPSAPPPPTPLPAPVALPPSNPIPGTFAQPGTPAASPFRTPAFNAAARFQGGTEGPTSFGPGVPLTEVASPLQEDKDDDILAQLFALASSQAGR